MFVLEHLDTRTAQVTICEGEDGICYLWFTTLAGAIAEADRSNASAIRNGEPSRYHAIACPPGLRLAHDCGREG